MGVTLPFYTVGLFNNRIRIIMNNYFLDYDKIWLTPSSLPLNSKQSLTVSQDISLSAGIQGTK